MQERTIVVYGNHKIGDEIARAFVSNELQKMKAENERLQKKLQMYEDFRHLEKRHRANKVMYQIAPKSESKIVEMYSLMMGMLIVHFGGSNNRRKCTRKSAGKSRGFISFKAGGAA